MASVLPPAFQAAQLKIKKINKILFYLLIILFVTGIFFISLIPTQPGDRTPLFAMYALLVFYVLWVVVGLMYLNHLCRKYGYVCPHCDKPLYDQRNRILETGLCPSCKKSVLQQ